MRIPPPFIRKAVITSQVLRLLRVCAFGMVLTLVFACDLRAQDFWVKKDYRQWTASECEKLLKDSPWAKSITVASNFRSALPGGERVSVAIENPSKVIYRMQLRSAVPIRRAMVRQSQFDSEHKKLMAEEFQILEQRRARLLSAEFTDRIVVVVYYSTTQPDMAVDVIEAWESRPPEAWKANTFLVSSTGKTPPLEVSISHAQRGQFQLVFPRLLDGRPVVSPNETRFSIELSQPTIAGVPGERLRFEFSVKDLLFEGRIEY